MNDFRFVHLLQSVQLFGFFVLHFPHFAEPSFPDRVKYVKTVLADLGKGLGWNFGDLSFFELKRRLELKIVVFFLLSVSKWIRSALV